MINPDFLSASHDERVAAIVYQKVRLAALGYVLDTGIPIDVCPVDRIELQTGSDGTVTTLFDYEGPSHQSMKDFERKVSAELTNYPWVDDVQDRGTFTGEVQKDGQLYTRSIGVQQITLNPNWPFS